MTKPKTKKSPRRQMLRLPTVRLMLVPNAQDAEGEPRIALEVPPQPGAISRRPALLMFASIAAALTAKRSLEEARA